MSKISSETLFNFTDKYEYFIDNLYNGFFCSTNYEKLPGSNIGYSIPMVCFCDIPLSLIKDHFDWYGRYGIGIKRSYARQLGVKPVWYVTSENEIINKMFKDISNIPRYEKEYLIPYMKMFLGYQVHPVENIKKRKKFYDENEWRYIPDEAHIQLLGKNANDKVYRMELDMDSIEYLIIKEDDDFTNVLKDLKEIAKKNKVGFEYLLSKIITATKIERDF